MRSGERPEKRLAVDAVLAAGIVDGVEARNRAPDATHPELQKHADRLRRAAHHIVDQIIKSNGHARLRPASNGSADGAAALCAGTNSGAFASGKTADTHLSSWPGKSARRVVAPDVPAIHVFLAAAI
jgi:hypothetical protein